MIHIPGVSAYPQYLSLGSFPPLFSMPYPPGPQGQSKHAAHCRHHGRRRGHHPGRVSVSHRTECVFLVITIMTILDLPVDVPCIRA